MRCSTFPEPTKRIILWFLKQFLGLSDALRGIHNLSDSDSGSESTTNLLAPRQDIRKSGWHHDLKPQNILYFVGSGSELGWFMIADFGSGKVHTYRSGSVNTRSPNGTLTYEPPEAANEGVTSRPYDIWSMGCVFLELLIWATYGYSAVRQFAKDRAGPRFPESTTNVVEDDAFFFIDIEGGIYRRSAVTTWLDKLDHELRTKMQPFGKVLDLVNRMLDTNRLNRISALDLWDTLDRIYKQTKVDLGSVKSDSVSEPTDRPTNLRLSTKVPDRRTPEPTSPGLVQRPEGHIPRTPHPNWTGNDFLTASPQPTSSTLKRRRNSSISGYSDVSDVRMGERSNSNLSSTHVQDGSSLHSNGGRSPDPPNARSG